MSTIFKNISIKKLETHARLVVTHMAHHLVWKNAEFICSYIPMKQECNILPLITLAQDSGKRLYVPLPDTYATHILQLDTRVKQLPLNKKYSTYRTLSRVSVPPLHCGTIKETRNFILQESQGIILVPGLAFSYSGQRLGRGGGFFDRFLATFKMAPTIVSIGVCCSEQMVRADDIPIEPHDQQMDYILNEKGLYNTRKTKLMFSI